MAPTASDPNSHSVHSGTHGPGDQKPYRPRGNRVTLSEAKGLRTMIYFNYAALCPTHPDVDREVQRTLMEFKQRWYSDTGVEWYRNIMQVCRQRVATLLRVRDPSSIAFTANATTAHALALASLKWDPGDTLITTTHENPSIARRLHALARRGVHVHAVRPESPEAFLHEVQERLNGPGVKAIVMSHVSHVDGRIFPVRAVAALARPTRCPVIIDGAQAVGHLPVDVETQDADVYFFSGHKWCEGPLGTGAMVVRERFFTHPHFRPVQEDRHGDPPAAQFELGTHNVGLIAGLAKACELRHQKRLETERLTGIREEVKQTLGGTERCRFMKWSGPHAPGILTFQGTPDVDHGRFATQLAAERGIIVKPFVDYPVNDAPAIRLSWLPTLNQQDLHKGLSAIMQRLEA